MPAMSRLERAACQSAPWRALTRQRVLPWALQGIQPRGDVLEIGAGSGAMAHALLTAHPDINMCVTDYDDVMVTAAADRLSPFGSRVTTRQADATALPFADASFDTVLSWIMLHHTVAWEQVLQEVVRVLRPGGVLVGYDLVDAGALRRLHRGDATHRMIGVDELRAELARLPVEDVDVRPGRGRVVMRFLARRASV